MESGRQAERLMLAAGTLAVAASVLVAYPVREVLVEFVPGLKASAPLPDYLRIMAIFVPAWMIVAERRGLFALGQLASPRVEFLRALLFVQGASLAVLAVVLALLQVRINRSYVALAALLSTAAVATVGAASRRSLRKHRRSWVSLIVGSAPAEVEAAVEEGRVAAVERVAPVVADVRARLARGGVEAVVVWDVPDDGGTGIVECCEDVGVPAFVRLRPIDLRVAKPHVETIGKTLVLAYTTRETDTAGLFLKIVFDRTVAAALLIVLGAPMLLIALLVRWTSRGPALFVQERGGLFGRPFRMLKFRTMHAGAEEEREALLAANEMDGPVFKISNDPRITPFGRILRRTSLDELPQLVNVLLGDMSLVGPRPLPVVEVADLRPVQRRRQSVRPGITCLWQVSGRNELTFEEWMALDLLYIDTWSLSLDFAILLRTIPAAIGGRGAR